MIWEIDFSRKPANRDQGMQEDARSGISLSDIESVYLLHWREHCLECAIPQCYRTCPLYIPRVDRKCARFQYGIFPNPHYSGLYDFGADIHFRRWGKIGSTLRAGTISIRMLRILERINRILVKYLVNPVSSFLQPVNHRRRLNGALVFGRERLFHIIGKNSSAESLRFDEFLIEAWNPSGEEFNLFLEVEQGPIVFRESYPIKPGANLHQIPFEKMNLDLSKRKGGIQLYPENDAEVRIIFTWMGFVRYRKKPASVSIEGWPRSKSETSIPAPAAKVKCVVWDLDDTLWDGILIEDGPEKLRPRSEAIQLVKDLDERGIVQSIASKNDYEPAWKVIQDMGLEDYFLCPAIHWGPKSESLKRVATELNINVDTLALIDDSAFERGEVTSQLPQIRVFQDTEIPNLLKLSEFDVPITETSRTRRLSYLTEAKRKRIAASHGANYLEFLKECMLEAEIFIPRKEKEIARCLELLQRSNQLNLSTHRYDSEEFRGLLGNEKTMKIATRCKDRFGNYGIIGFSSIIFEDGRAVMKDFVQSCRVAQKKLENAWFKWMENRLTVLGYEKLHTTFIPTDRNHVLLEVLIEVGFQEVSKKGDSIELELALNVPPPHAEIVKVIDTEVDLDPEKLRSRKST